MFFLSSFYFYPSIMDDLVEHISAYTYYMVVFSTGKSFYLITFSFRTLGFNFCGHNYVFKNLVLWFRVIRISKYKKALASTVSLKICFSKHFLINYYHRASLLRVSLLFSGYFLYDFGDMVIHNKVFKMWELTLHHVAVSGSFVLTFFLHS